MSRSKRELIAENIFLRQRVDRIGALGGSSSIETTRPAAAGCADESHPRLARGAHHRAARYVDRLAQARVQAVLAAENTDQAGEAADALIEEMAIKNQTWRAKRIQGELLKLGFKVSRDTVRKYMRQARKKLPPLKRGQGWATFLAKDVGVRFLQTYDLLFRTVFVYFIIELRSRRVVHYGVTRAPSDRWVAQQVREATPYDASPRFLIQDNDNKFGACFNRVAEERHIKVLRTPVRAPQAHAICERFIGSVRREFLDHILILSERQLYRAMGE